MLDPVRQDIKLMANTLNKSDEFDVFVVEEADQCIYEFGYVVNQATKSMASGSCLTNDATCSLLPSVCAS